MSNKLRDAIDEIQSYVDNREAVPVFCFEELQEVIEAAYMYWDLSDEDEDYE